MPTRSALPPTLFACLLAVSVAARGQNPPAQPPAQPAAPTKLADFKRWVIAAG